MITTNQRILLADDDADDCLFFQEVLDELPVNCTLQIANDGVELMALLTDNSAQLPEIIFLDLNLPRKNGLECLLEIKENERLKQLPIIIISTSLHLEIVNLVYQKGAHYYIRKPGEFSKLKAAIFEALQLTYKNYFQQPERADFVLQS